MRRLPARSTLTLPLFALLALGACGGADRPTLSSVAAPTTNAPSTATDVEPQPAAPSTTVAPSAPTSLDARGLVARLRGELEYFDAPNGTALGTLSATTEFGSATTLAGIEWASPAQDWLRVALPIRPNGATAYVLADSVDLGRTDLRVEVDLTARRLVVRDGAGVVIDTSIAIGASETPTPTGRFFVTDVLDNPDDSGAYGPFALGLSAHSDVLDQFGGGDGQIGIHGTDQPGSIGQAASHGCVRVPNDIVTQLAGRLPLGTPVTIR